MNFDEIIKQAEAECRPWKANIVRCAKAYIEAEKAWRANPYGLKAWHGPKSDPMWAEYYRVSDAFHKAESDLWMASDIEYGDDPIANASWEWRYWSVMARKCCHSMKTTGNSDWAATTMSKLAEAEKNYMAACGLLGEYTSPNEYLEAAFPNLKSQ